MLETDSQDISKPKIEVLGRMYTSTSHAAIWQRSSEVPGSLEVFTPTALGICTSPAGSSLICIPQPAPVLFAACSQALIDLDVWKA